MNEELNNKNAVKLKHLAHLIAHRRETGKPLNRYEYYMLGGISIRKGESELYRLLSEGKLTMSEVSIIHNYIESQLAIVVPRKKESILATHYQFGDRIITNSEKENIWEELKAFGLEETDIDDLVFSGAVRDYAIKNGLIASKKLIKQK